MSDHNVIMRVENLSKLYRLGTIGTGTLSHDLNRWWHKVRGKEDPYTTVGEVNDRTSTSNTSDYVWALQDINFDVRKGEVLGIIGKNGAGKSTLLKILSKVTGPTTGTVRAKGRIASLLEVGTGFHPELTGKENVYLNGAILGMTRKEIDSKLDEIISFSGCERYIDTPVKRYSSGMKVRLAFAVAAHLEPEILVVDEVLAVGDAEFQKKAIGKMKDISSGEGRTVIFVSHNMTAVQSLCQRAILMQHGRISMEDDVEPVIDAYLRLNSESLHQSISFETQEKAPGNAEIRIQQVSVTPEKIHLEDAIHVQFSFWNNSPESELKVAFDLVNMQEAIVFSTYADVVVESGQQGHAQCTIPAHLLNDDLYSVELYIFTAGMRNLYHHQDIVNFEVHDRKRDYAYYGKVNGVIRPKLEWQVGTPN